MRHLFFSHKPNEWLSTHAKFIFASIKATENKVFRQHVEIVNRIFEEENVEWKRSANKKGIMNRRKIYSYISINQINLGEE